MNDFDVVVVGGGPAGMAAALAAAEAGAEVAILEATDKLGGNASLSTGYLAFVDVPFQRQHGVKDSQDLFLSDAARQFAANSQKAAMIWDEELTKLFARECIKAYEFLIAQGVQFSRLIPRPAQHSVDRLLAVDDPSVIADAYAKKLKEHGVRVLFGHDALRLLTDERGRVVGVEAARSGDNKPEAVSFGARRGVVLGTGGYQANLELRKRYQLHSDINRHIVGLGTCRGSGQVMGAALGADLINMVYIQPMVLVPSLLVEDAIAVNIDGKRFHDEAGPYGERVKALAEQPQGKAYFVIDGETLKTKAALVEKMPERGVVKDTVADLAEAVGCAGAHLQASIDRWNDFLASGDAKDPDFGRVVLPVARRKILRPPFAAIPMVKGISFTWGGLNVTLDMQVVTVDGETIPGLFAAGDTVGGMNVISSLGGTHITAGLTFGRIAGSRAATGASAVPHLPTPGRASQLQTSGVRMALVEIADRRGAG